MFWKEYLEQRLVRRAAPDKEFAKSLISMAEDRRDFLQKQTIDHRNCSILIADWYEALRQICEAIAAVKGFKFYSHEAYAAFLKEVLQEPFIAERFDRYRKIRIGVNYYAKSIAKEEADRGRLEIEAMIQQLRAKYLAFLEKEDTTIILGLTGPNSAGKGEVAKYLIEKKCFIYHSCSDVIREECTKKGLEHSRENLIAVGNELREKFGPAILAKQIMEKIKNKKGNVIVDSIRNPAEVVELKKLPNFILVMVDAPMELRFERAKARGRVENAETLEAFNALEESEKSDDPAKQQLHKVFAMADKKIVNEGTMEALHQKIETILK